jgi:hypothetical protein
MARGKKRSRSVRTPGRRLAASALAAALVLCGASIAVGVMNWMTRTHGDELTDNIRIEVLNGTGEKGLGRTVARELMKRRIDVLSVDNADRFDYSETVLVVRKKKPEVESLFEMLGCRRRVEQLSADSRVDATLIVGDDYRSLDLGLADDSRLSE